MAAVLILLHNARGRGFVHVNTLISATYPPRKAAALVGDFAKLRYWGLIEERAAEEGSDKKSSGKWRITQQGSTFVEGRSRVYKHIYVYNDRYLGVVDDGQVLNIHTALGERFDYQALMGAGCDSKILGEEGFARKVRGGVTQEQLTETLEAARASFFAGAKRSGGTYCPCCERYGKIYKRKIHSAMAAVLIQLYRERDQGFVHLNGLVNASFPPTVAAACLGVVTKFRYWGFIEKDPRDNTDGYWRISEPGRAFVEGSLAYKSIYVYNDTYLGVADGGSTVDIRAALGEKFSYAELMG